MNILPSGQPGPDSGHVAGNELDWIKEKGSAPPLAWQASRQLVNAEGPTMPVNLDELLPTAREIQRQAALADAEELMVPSGGAS